MTTENNKIDRKYVDIELMRKISKRRTTVLNTSKSNILLTTNTRAVLPPSYSLVNRVPFIYDQGNLGSCTANAFCISHVIMQNIKNNTSTPGFLPSRLFLYYYERKAIGTVNYDSGAYMIDGCKYAKNSGISSEALWPYIISRYRQQPSASARNNAKLNKIKSYKVLPLGAAAVLAVKTEIAANRPVLIGYLVYDSFVSSVVENTGVVPMPNISTEALLGGHEIAIIGYDDNTSLFTCVNSWGLWADAGKVYLPYAYIADRFLTMDLMSFTI